MFLFRCLTPKSLEEIGAYFGGRDHSTVLHAIDKVKKRVASDEYARAEIVSLLERLAGGQDPEKVPRLSRDHVRSRMGSEPARQRPPVVRGSSPRRARGSWCLEPEHAPLHHACRDHGGEVVRALPRVADPLELSQRGVDNPWIHRGSDGGDPVDPSWADRSLSETRREPLDARGEEARSPRLVHSENGVFPKPWTAHKPRDR